MSIAGPQSIAIVGIGTIFPDASEPDLFWDNIRHRRSAAREVPDGRWGVASRHLYDPEPGKPDRLYSLRGCFIDTLPPLSALAGLNIDPGRLAGLDPLFHLLLHAGKRALDDAKTASIDRSRIGTIIGNLALPTEKSALLARQWLGRTFAEKLRVELPDRGTAEPLNRYVAGLPAGLLSQALGLGGASHTLDAACASSLYAIKLAAMELISGRADAMLTGGVSRPDSLYTQMGFSQLRALSARGVCSPFDARGDGLVVGEGVGIFLLKRTADAVAHGDRIYGVIRGIGLANDVGGSLLAPLSEGQLRAMRAAYAQCGWEPGDVDLIECHATGTPVGDAVEFASLRELWGDARPEGQGCVIGSVKSNIGHLLTAAGAAALTKVLLAMAAGIFPPTANFSVPPPTIDLENSPFRVLTDEEPWERRRAGIPRRAAVSAFGFGGINAHLLVEEWLPASHKSTSSTPSISSTTPPPIAVVGMDARFGPWQSLAAFRERVLEGSRTIAPTSPEKWRGARESAWFTAEGLHRTPFKGYYMEDFSIPAGEFRIPPKEMEEMLPQQLLMLRVAAAAMADAGLDREDNKRGGVFIGIALDLNTTNFSFRWVLAEDAATWAGELAPGLPPEQLDAWLGSLREAAGPPLTANRTMGALGSIVASRIAREYRFGGPGFTLSSEENSGLSALASAVRLLQGGEIDRALVGAVDLAGDIRAVLGHHAVRPLSASGRGAPFAEDADGPLIGEGAAAVVLKRLDDAERDGDRIYAVIRGIGASSGGIIFPGEGAYGLALDRAYEDAGIEPVKVSCLEAGAGGSPAEDLMEARTLAAHFGPAKRRCALSGVKGEIGHCGAASGLASLVRGCLVLYQEIIPPSPAAEKPMAEVVDGGPLYLPATPRYWLRDRCDGPRRAGVSSFGVDGSCFHAVLEGWDRQPLRVEVERFAPLGPCSELLFTVSGMDRTELYNGLGALQRLIAADEGKSLYDIAHEWYLSRLDAAGNPLAVAMVARNREELTTLIGQGNRILGEQGDGCEPLDHPALRGRFIHSPQPLGGKGKTAFIFPGSGNHFPGMGAALSARWPGLFRNRDAANLRLAGHFQPELIWNGASVSDLNGDPRAIISGQVAVGCAVSDIVRHFGVSPDAVIGYSLGESAGLFALDAWHDRDGMLGRMAASTLFTRDLAGEFRAARIHWGMGPDELVEWRTGLVDAPAQEVRRAIDGMARVYLLIVNTPDECVIGGDAREVERLVASLGCRFYPLSGVTAAHCAIARAVAAPYRELHLFDATPPLGVRFFSCARGQSFAVDRESAADSMLAQAVDGFDFTRVIESAYTEGIRVFVEIGPGSSCSRMIGKILAGRPHMARSACFPGIEPESAILRLLGHLVAERVQVDLAPLFPREAATINSPGKSAEQGNLLQVTIGGKPFQPPLPAFAASPCPSLEENAGKVNPLFQEEEGITSSDNDGTGGIDESLLRGFAAAQEARLKAHDAFLRFSGQVSRSMEEALGLGLSLREILPDEDLAGEMRPFTSAAHTGTLAEVEGIVKESGSPRQVVLDREMCLEFARGLVGPVLGPAFAEADTLPTRVRLPDDPLMLVDRIVVLEGEARSMTSGRVVTEHDIHENAWYLDGGRIPTCIAVEAGQADLFLSGYLGIDFITRGKAVYRLLDAVVTFHRELPVPGETICYDIRIERFFQQGETRFFRFLFDATVNGEPLLTMRDGCAGFFTAAELAAGKGIVAKKLDLLPRTGTRSDDWVELTPLFPGSYDARQLDLLRDGDLAGCFGPLFAGLDLRLPLTIPGGRMRLVHRVTALEPAGGRYGLGMIRAEADISPDDWFLTCHFTDDRVMPGTLMYECCLHTLRIFLLRAGWVAESSTAAWQPVPGVSGRLCCRGQVLETTATVAYQIEIREIGYRPEPFAIVDALMFADGKPIVEITGMSARLTGTTREALIDLWRRRDTASGSTTGKSHGTGNGGRKPPVYTKEQILAYSNGRPSEGFGEPYRVFDNDRIIARLPGPPYQFVDRITQVRGEPWRMAAGAMAEAQYDVPADAWYFAAERQPAMPFAVLLETSLQPCGWLAAYVGSALTSPVDLSFRNLGGNAVLHRQVTPECGILTTAASLKKVAASGGMIIQEFTFTVADNHGVLYEGDTMFGFFSREALANQVGIRDAAPYLPNREEIARGTSRPYPESKPFPDKKLRMIDSIDICIPDGGPAGLGFIRGLKVVDPDEWFFKAHFFQDPVTPGSLGLESFLQLLKFIAVERWGWREKNLFVPVTPGSRHEWLYRGQVIPANRQVTVEASVTAIDDRERKLTADGLLSVDGRPIYRMKDFTLGME